MLKVQFLLLINSSRVSYLGRGPIELVGSVVHTLKQKGVISTNHEKYHEIPRPDQSMHMKDSIRNPAREAFLPLGQIGQLPR